MAKQPLTGRDKLILVLLAVAALAVVGYRYLTRSSSDWDVYDRAQLVGIPSVVSFSTGSCPSCVEQKKVFAALKPELAGKARLLSVNVSVDSPQIRAAIQEFQIRYVPTLVFFDAAGQVVDVHVGYVTADQLRTAFRTLGADL